MKKGGNKLFLVAGVALAAVAIALLASSMLGDTGEANTSQQPKQTKVTVVEAAVDIPAHTLLTAEDLVEVQVDESEAAADAVRSKLEVVGMAYRKPLVKGERLVMSQTEQPGLRNDIEPGKRAVSLPADAVNLLSGLVQDGDYIDVIFDARLNLIRLLPTTLAIAGEDEPSYSFSSGSTGRSGDEEESGVAWLPPGVELPNHPFTGDPGSHFIIRDATGDEGQLEPVAKIIVQDVRVLRVVRPGESYLPNGTRAEAAASDVAAPVSEDQTGYLILEVTPQQAEVLAFIDDERHEYRILVRGNDDHEQVTTTGITFEILATDSQWALPWPQSLTAPQEQTRGSGSAAATPTAAATPQSGSSADTEQSDE